MKYFILILGLFLSVSGQAAVEKRNGFQWDAVERLAIQDRGRLKPLQTFAEESVLYVTGGRSWSGLSAMEVLFGWLISYEKEWQNEKFIRLDFKPLKQEMGWNPEQKYFSPEEIRESEKFNQLISSLAQKERRKERLSATEKKARDLLGKRRLVEAIVSGQVITILPNPKGRDEDWFALANLAESPESLPYTMAQKEQLSEHVRNLLTSFLNRESTGWNKAGYALVDYLSNDLAKGVYPPASEVSREIHYNDLRPFRVTWILYLLSFILMLWHLVGKNKVALYAALGTLAAGFALHSYGFVIRCLIAGRPPVTNMYESVIWVTWGALLFAGIVWFVYRNPVVLAASSVFSVVGLVLADNLPSVLDPGIHPLEPVLRSNFWLTIHVLCITLSYAAFAVSLCLGNVVLGNYLFRPLATDKSQEYSLYMYRAMQIGVILLAAGTILGGVWADYSWGRFWGWDPKEVWALVALLLYLAVLHGRFTGWLKGFGFAATAVVAFLGVLMAWYGVNFVLGVGLHSYGFGSGGYGWVSVYVLSQLGFIVASYIQYRKAQQTHNIDRGIFPKGGGVN